MKSLPTYVVLLFFQCWTHCSMSQYGAYMEDSGKADSGCEVCDLLTDGTTPTAKVSITAPAVALVDELPLTAPVVTLVAVKTFTPAQPFPPPRWRLCEFLASTACPVRGPACLQA